MRYLILKSLVTQKVFTIHIYNMDQVRYVDKKIDTYFDINRFLNYQNTEFTFLIKLNVKIQNSNQ